MKNKSYDFVDTLEKHRKFTEDYYKVENLNNKQKEELLKTLCLALHHETSQVVKATNFKVFDKENYEVNTNEIVYNTVDAYRYMMAILGLYNIDAHEFMSAYKEKDLYLEVIKNLNEHKENQPVVVFDIDDIIADFREYFNGWLYRTYDILIDKDSKSYYSSKEVKNHGYSPEVVFERFIKDNELLNIPLIDEALNTIKYFKEKGFYVQLLTSRPESNLKCKYQTYMWLHNNNVPYDNLAFASEKYIWLAKKDYYIKGNVKFAVDDSPKHSMEYATHDIKVIMPKLPYNETAVHSNILPYDRENMENYFKNLDV